MQLNLHNLVFKTFDMKVSTRLSFRDDDSSKYAGNPEMWEKAEREIQEVADMMGLDYFIGIGEASFYGPKVDFIVRDAIGRKWQLGTVQVDYVMPERFELEYTGSDNQKHRPVIIHRAPFGSMERFMSILIEHYAGNFPFWLASVQVSILPVSQNQNDYAQSILQLLNELGFRADADYRAEKVNRKIAESEQKKIPYAIIVGQKEEDSKTISLREHGVGDLGTKTIEDTIHIFQSLNVPQS